MKRWLKRRHISKKTISERMGISEADFEYRLEFWELFNEQEIESLVYFMGAKAAFYVIYFPSFSERKRVYYATFGRKWRYRKRRKRYYERKHGRNEQ